MTTIQKRSQFFYFYMTLTIITAVVAIIPMLLWGWSSQTPAVNSPLSIMINVVEGVLGLTTFICSIVALVQFIKRKYGKLAISVPIVYFAFDILGIAAGLFWTFSAVFGQMQSLGANATPEQVQQISEQLTLPWPLLALGIVKSLVLVILAAWALIEAKPKT